MRVSETAPPGFLVIEHRQDGGALMTLKVGAEVLAQVTLTPHQKRLLGYELILGNHFGDGTLPVTLVAAAAAPEKNANFGG